MIQEPSKAVLLALKPFAGYEVSIGSAPALWATQHCEVASKSALRLKALVEEEFPGLIAKITSEAITYPSFGLDAEVMERIDCWLCDNAISVVLA